MTLGPACMRTLSVQAVTAFKKCGHVMCTNCAKKFVKPTSTCFVCSKKVAEKDWIRMEQGGTGFASHNKVEAIKYRPTK